MCYREETLVPHSQKMQPRPRETSRDTSVRLPPRWFLGCPAELWEEFHKRLIVGQSRVGAQSGSLITPSDSATLPG